MTSAALGALLGPEFDDFLFAPVGDDGNGMLLSVISALVRLDIDPWLEAAKLAQMPGEVATKRLASLIAALPDRASVHLDSGTIATRLIALLPRRAGPNLTSSRQAMLRIGALTSSKTFLYYIAFVAFVLGSQWFIATRHPAAQSDTASPPAASTVSPEKAPLNTGK
jgi:hypothetical protein